MQRFMFLMSVAIAAGRLFITPRLTNIPTWELSYESVAHIFVGFLFGIAWCGDEESLIAWRLAWGLSFWELFLFILQKSLS